MAKEYRFSGQNEGEQVLLLMRRHYLTFFGPFFFSVLTFVIPLIVWFYIFAVLNIFSIDNQILWTGAAIWTIIGFFFLAYHWLDWYLDIYLVTTLRIIDINQDGLFHRTVAEASLDHIEDIVYEIKGVLPTLFNYGTIIIHTAGPTGDICFQDVSNPQKIQRYLLTEVESYKDAKAEKLATPEDLLHIFLEHQKEKMIKGPDLPNNQNPTSYPPKQDDKDSLLLPSADGEK
jgi:hypothetical protein